MIANDRFIHIDPHDKKLIFSNYYDLSIIFKENKYHLLLKSEIMDKYDYVYPWKNPKSNCFIGIKDNFIFQYEITD